MRTCWFVGDAYLIAIYFVETVVSDSFLDSTPEYRRLKLREETQVKIASFFLLFSFQPFLQKYGWKYTASAAISWSINVKW